MIEVSKFNFRVVAGGNPFPLKVYEGNDIREALMAFEYVLPDDDAFTMRHDIHSVTGEPMIEVRDPSGFMAAAIYGITKEEWDKALQVAEDLGLATRMQGKTH